MFDVLAIDWGEKRFGIATGSSPTGLVLPYDKPVETDMIWEVLDKQLQAKKILTFVIGVPTSFEGKETETSLKIKAFINELTNKYPLVKIATVNERYSTKLNKGLLRKNDTFKQNINHLAAADILNRYLEKNL